LGEWNKGWEARKLQGTRLRSHELRRGRRIITKARKGKNTKKSDGWEARKLGGYKAVDSREQAVSTRQQYYYENTKSKNHETELKGKFK